MKQIILPYKVNLRHYQEEAWNAFFEDELKHLLLVWHRRAGKSKFAVNVIAAASQMRIGAYYYLFPRLTQARRVIWEGRGEDGFRFMDHFPPEIIKNVNNTEMKIEFKNGSIFRLLGTDNLNYDSLMGGNPLGILYDEFAMQNPIARDYLIPILAENNGWEIFISTPRGTNHFFELYQYVKNNPEWFVSLLTIDDTRRDNGESVVSRDTIDQLRASGWSDDKVEQEFFCSFEAAVRGAYFSSQLKKAELDNRIRDFPFNSALPVNTYWDLGMNDSTAIWVAQEYRNEIYLIAYYENNNEPLLHYINWIKDFRDRHQLTIGKNYGPHDVAHRNFATGKSVRESAADLGFNFERVKRIAAKQDAIEMARSIFSRCYFHKSNCKEGIGCLREYHKAYNDKLKVYSDRPVHNWASHGADAFMTMAQAMEEEYTIGSPARVQGDDIFSSYGGYNA